MTSLLKITGVIPKVANLWLVQRVGHLTSVSLTNKLHDVIIQVDNVITEPNLTLSDFSGPIGVGIGVFRLSAFSDFFIVRFLEIFRILNPSAGDEDYVTFARRDKFITLAVKLV